MINYVVIMYTDLLLLFVEILRYELYVTCVRFCYNSSFTQRLLWQSVALSLLL